MLACMRTHMVGLPVPLILFCVIVVKLIGKINTILFAFMFTFAIIVVPVRIVLIVRLVLNTLFHMMGIAFNYYLAGIAGPVMMMLFRTALTMTRIPQVRLASLWMRTRVPPDMRITTTCRVW